jgi:hypothetical protein
MTGSQRDAAKDSWRPFKTALALSGPIAFVATPSWCSARPHIRADGATCYSFGGRNGTTCVRPRAKPVAPRILQDASRP